MDIILNGLTNPQQIISFNNIPTILKIDSSGSGTKAKLELTVSTGGNTRRRMLYNNKWLYHNINKCAWKRCFQRLFSAFVIG